MNRRTLRLALPAAFAALTFALVALSAGGWAAPANAGTIPVSPMTLLRIATGLDQPIQVTNAGDGTLRLFIVEQDGIVRIWKDGRVLNTPFLNIDGRVNSSCGECGLLGIAFPPDFAQSQVFYVNYSATGNPISPGDESEPDPSPNGNDTVIARYKVSANSDVADPNSEERLLLVNQPYTNHNGGLLKFGPDGYLYIGMGDGGSGGDPLGKGQALDTLLGKMLRISVGATGGYTIPSSNPFTDTVDALPEIWAYGLRNPWRWSFDRLNGDLYIADVGQGEWEEINHQPAGATGGRNYGWDITEGTHCYPANVTNCDKTGLTLPVHEYGHDLGSSVTGGYVYRGEFESIQGLYFFGDFSSSQIWAMKKTGSTWEVGDVLNPGFQVASFGEDEMGELYVVDYGGSVYRLMVSNYAYDTNIRFPFVNNAPVGSPNP